MSALHRAEVLAAPARAGRLEEAVLRLDQIGVHTVGVPADAARRLATIRASTGSRMPDRCVLLAAEMTGGEVATFDTRLRASAQALGLRCVPDQD
jgi:predicted nucleic acid-binding protein